MISRSTLFSAPGGDTVQIKETAEALQSMGIEYDILLSDEKIDYQQYNLLHFFNVIRPNTIIPHIRASKLPYVVSTIFVDYTEVEQKLNGWKLRWLLKCFGSDRVEYLKTIARSIKNGEKLLDWSYLFRGHKKSVEKVLEGAKILLPNSLNEYKRLQRRYVFQTGYQLVPNAVNSVFFTADLHAKRQQKVVCVARIEPIKNQLNLIRAVKNTNIQLELIGIPSPNHRAYYEKCRLESGENVRFLGQMQREEIIDCLKKTKVHILPSWFETTGLSSLEAGALGCNVIITARGDTKEYFGELVFYCNPASPVSIREAIQKALSKDISLGLNKKIRENFRWDIAAKKTLEAYKKALGV